MSTRIHGIACHLCGVAGPQAGPQAGPHAGPQTGHQAGPHAGLQAGPQAGPRFYIILTNRFRIFPSVQSALHIYKIRE